MIIIVLLSLIVVGVGIVAIIPNKSDSNDYDDDDNQFYKNDYHSDDNNDNHSNHSDDDYSNDINPATGLPMIDDTIDIGGHINGTDWDIF